MTRSNFRVAIIHPWFPQYRAPFFERLISEGRRKTIDFRIFYGSPPPEWGERGDSVTADYATALRTRFIPLGKRNLGAKSLKPLWQSAPYDLIVLEQAVRNLETYALMLHWRHARLAFWGHGKTYTVQTSATQERAKRWLTNCGSWFFAYTEGGARAVIRDGFDASRVTVVQNTIDAAGLRCLIDNVDPAEVLTFGEQHGLTSHTALYIGGLDEQKRIPFLLAAAMHARELDASFRLVIAGNGAFRATVEEVSAREDWITYLGPLFGRDKALAMASASVLTMPGRVGLVAVDSFASGIPIVTTDWPWHAPEFEYLVNGENAVIAENNEAEYGRAIVDLMRDSSRLRELQRGARASMARFSLDEMVDRFLTGILAAVENVHVAL